MLHWMLLQSEQSHAFMKMQPWPSMHFGSAEIMGLLASKDLNIPAMDTARCLYRNMQLMLEDAHDLLQKQFA